MKKDSIAYWRTNATKWILKIQHEDEAQQFELIEVNSFLGPRWIGPRVSRVAAQEGQSYGKFIVLRSHLVSLLSHESWPYHDEKVQKYRGFKKKLASSALFALETFQMPSLNGASTYQQSIPWCYVLSNLKLAQWLSVSIAKIYYYFAYLQM